MFHHESFSFESIVFIVMTVYELCSDHSDNENGDELGVAHQPLDRSVSIVDGE